ncbi:MAG: DUF1549 domain-containing protein, partial [Planctomycetota bacterium]
MGKVKRPGERLVRQAEFLQRLPAIVTAFALTLALGIGAPTFGEKAIRFGTDVLPILSEHCFTCHGPDEATRSTELRFDERESAFADLGGYTAIVPGNAESSEAIRRVFSTDPDEVMPPPEAKLELSSADRETLRRWVEEGAVWERHWAFDAPSAPDTTMSVEEQIDAEVRARLEEKGLAPSPPADATTLLRRVFLVLTGLPPTEKDRKAFAADPSSEAYEAIVDRLLASDECAEWLALEWMDVARYADSHGLHADGSRTSWPWRDWVINAFHDNMPYDEFVTWQLAGDLMPYATRDQRLATAFLRNHPMTGEGGVIDEEFRWNYVFDRVETFGTAVLGLTMQCCRCHDHKFDPISQREYYEVAAFFNNFRELGMTGDDGDYGPLLALPDDDSAAKMVALDRAIDTLRTKLAEQPDAHTDKGLYDISLFEPHRHLPMEGIAAIDSSDGEADAEKRVDGASFLTSRNPAGFVPGVVGQAARIEGDYGFLEMKSTALIDVADALSVAMWIHPQPREEGAPRRTRCLIGNAGDKNKRWRGLEFFLDEKDRLAVTLTSGMPAERIHIRTRERMSDGEWIHVAFTYDGRGEAAGVRLYVDGQAQNTEVIDDRVGRSIYPIKDEAGYPKDPDRLTRIGRSHRNFTGDNGVYVGAVDELYIYEADLTAVEVALLYDRQRPTNAIAASPKLTEQQKHAHRQQRSDDFQTIARDLRSLLAMRVDLATDSPQVMVAREVENARTTHVLDRGLYDQPKEAVSPNTPAAVGRMPEDARRDRLGLAGWAFGEENPLAARVAVNRYWQFVFGAGLVGTPQDFGLQGARPTHPELLDELAQRFQQSGWDLRALLKAFVLSETFRQSSDPADRLVIDDV